MLLLLYLLASHNENFSHCKFTTDSTLAQSDLYSIRDWCVANLFLTKLKPSNLQGKLIKLIVFTNCVITRTDSIKDLEGPFDAIFFFQSLEMLGLLHTYMGAERDFFVHQSWRIEQMRGGQLVSVNFSLLFPHNELGWHLALR
jgi:hypothetical protein